MDPLFLHKYQLQWESRSSIRSRPRKPIDFSLPGEFFPADKQVLFLLPEVLTLSDRAKKEILVLSLHKYLKDIIHLESKWIHSVCQNIINKDLPVLYSDVVKLNASTVIIDEHYHMYIAYDLIAQLKNAFPLLPTIDGSFSDATHAIVTVKQNLDEIYHDLFEVIAVCIFETTLVRELVSFFDSATIHPSIKYYINDHMNDEARHFGFFFEILHYTWKNMPHDYQEEIGSKLGDFLKHYLHMRGEIEYNKNLLAWVTGEENKSKISIDRLYKDFELSSDIPIVKNVLNILEKAGVTSHETVRHVFLKHNLIS